MIQSNLVRTTILFAVLFPLISYAMTGEGMSFGRWIVTVAIFGSLMAAVEYVERRFLR
ncbi:hypothetical protein BGL_2c00590 [Burkholderia plantarii]|uniref:Uncharacterized protein n=1 Tax=Burkholderia plantarii TaxID=41899 RepID=A0A0B6RS28_BURPL|nr:hypothetical protein BGL_2c00590 [Burkholderia plantarii]